jgi:hypothetical protein
MQMTTIGPDLAEKSITVGGTKLGFLHGGIEGYKTYNRGPNDPAGIWRVVFGGLDPTNFQLNRDHIKRAMIPVNHAEERPYYYQLSVQKGSIYKNSLHYLYFVKAGLNPVQGKSDPILIGIAFQNTVADALGKQLAPDLPEYNLVTGAKDPEVNAIDEIVTLAPSANLVEYKPRSHIVEIKASDGVIYAGSRNGQIKKYIKYLSQYSPAAYTPVRPMLTLIGIRFHQWDYKSIAIAATKKVYPYDPDTRVSMVKVGGLRWIDGRGREISNPHNINLGFPVPMPGTRTPKLIPGTNQLDGVFSNFWNRYGLGFGTVTAAYELWGGVAGHNQGHFPPKYFFNR